MYWSLWTDSYTVGGRGDRVCQPSKPEASPPLPYSSPTPPHSLPPSLPPLPTMGFFLLLRTKASLAQEEKAAFGDIPLRPSPPLVSSPSGPLSCCCYRHSQFWHKRCLRGQARGTEGMEEGRRKKRRTQRVGNEEGGKHTNLLANNSKYFKYLFQRTRKYRQGHSLNGLVGL